MEDLEAEAFLADKAYDTNELLDMLKEADITAVIPPVKSRKEQRAYNHELYQARHVIENVFRALKRRRGARRIGGVREKSRLAVKKGTGTMPVPFYRYAVWQSPLCLYLYAAGLPVCQVL
jgi:transposase